jgi:hypothetical protein
MISRLTLFQKTFISCFIILQILKPSQRQNSVKSSRADSGVNMKKYPKVSGTDSDSTFRVLLLNPSSALINGLSAREDFIE